MSYPAVRSGLRGRPPAVVPGAAELKGGMACCPETSPVCGVAYCAEALSVRVASLGSSRMSWSSGWSDARNAPIHINEPRNVNGRGSLSPSVVFGARRSSPFLLSSFHQGLEEGQACEEKQILLEKARHGDILRTAERLKPLRTKPSARGCRMGHRVSLTMLAL